MRNISVSAPAPAAPLFPVSNHHERFLRLPEVMHLCGLSRSTVYDLISRDAFPKQIRLAVKMSPGHSLRSAHGWRTASAPVGGM